MSDNTISPLAGLPAVGLIIDMLKARGTPISQVDPQLLAHLTRTVIDSVRSTLKSELRQKREVQRPSNEEIIEQVEQAFATWSTSSTCRVINGSGIILHSGLGRAVYPKEAREQIAQAQGYTLLEVEKETGGRRRRDQFCADLLCSLTGAEAATVVNNNAAATLIILNELGLEKEIVVSRSQMIEIGGSFRLPDVFEAAGCKLVEVGTTNKSRVSDYDEAITENTGALMLVHTSNYRIVGFTDHVDLPEMVALGKKQKIPVIHDVGSGSLIDMGQFGVHDEPAVQFSVKTGADVICFSGDKLIGGPQAGIIIGKKTWIDRIRKNPLARALRIDKTACLALEATLKLYFEPDKLRQKIPTLAMLSEPASAVKERAEELAALIRTAIESDVEIRVIPSSSELGAGTLPTHGIDTFVIAVSWPQHSAQKIADHLRGRAISIFSRIREDQVQLDLRTMSQDDFAEVVLAFEELNHV